MKTTLVTIEDNPTLKPGILELGHRQLEKSQPAPMNQLGTEYYTYQIPVDLLSLLLPPAFVSDITSLEFTYRKGK